MKLNKKKLCWDLAEFSWDNGLEPKDFDGMLEHVFSHPEILRRYLSSNDESE